MRDTHNQQILRALKRGMRIDHIGALRAFGCTRLAARIWDLRCDGYNVVTEMQANPRTGARYAVYRLARKRKAAA